VFRYAKHQQIQKLPMILKNLPDIWAKLFLMVENEICSVVLEIFFHNSDN
jgi:hypothetical protein